jgi:uncharacterized protein
MHSPNPAAIQTLKPVNGSVDLPVGSLAVLGAVLGVLGVVAVEVVAAGAVAGVLELGVGLLDTLGVGVDVAGGVVAVLEFDGFPLSGSMYCWSPADGPLATAAAGPSSNVTQTTVSAATNFCQLLTLRVLQALKLFAFSDLHRDRGKAQRVVEQARDADVVIGAGDFASFHLGLGGIIDTLREITTPAVLVPGNNESDDALWRACGGWTAASVLHGEGTEIGGVQFFGLGAGVPNTPFPWSFDLGEEEAASKLADCPPGAVLVIHSPPKGYVDEAHGRHLGSDAILSVIERTQPVLAVCGHIHQSWGREARIGATRVVNVGPDGMFFKV